MSHWKNYNPNPLKRNLGDCVVRALSIALGQSWDETFDELAAQAQIQADMPSSDAVWGTILRRRGFVKKVIPDTCPDCYTAAAFAADHPRGTYVLAFGGHVATVKNGLLYDSWDSSRETPIYYFERGNNT